MAETGALMRHFDCGPGEYVFEIAGDGDEFWEALALLKEAIPKGQRRYDPLMHTWAVTATKQNARALRRIFENGDTCMLYAEGRASSR